MSLGIPVMEKYRRRRSIALLVGVLLAVIMAFWMWPHRELATDTAVVDVFETQPSPVPAPPRPEEDREEPENPLPMVEELPTADAEKLRLQARAIELEEDEDIDAMCTLELPLEEAEAYLAVGDYRDFDGRKVPVVLGTAYLPFLPDGPGSGTLSVEGYAPTPVSWDKGRCTPDPVPLNLGGTAVTGVVTHAETDRPAARAWVEGCGNLGITGSDGTYYMEVIAEPCLLFAMRQDGQLRTVGDSVEVSPQEGTDTVVNLVLPGFPRAGLGMRIEKTDDGVRILDVLEGSGAAEAGLESGDLIVAIDGETTIELTLGDFIDMAGGREGSEVSLSVASPNGQLQEIEVERLPVL